MARRLHEALLSLALLVAAPVSAFQVETLTGDRLDLLGQVGQGRWTLIQFWSLDCVPCERQKPMLEAFHRDHRAHDAHVVGVVLDGAAHLPAIRRRLDRGVTSFTQLLALADVFTAQYQSTGGETFRATPTYWLFDPEGRATGIHVGMLTRADLENVVKSR